MPAGDLHQLEGPFAIVVLAPERRDGLGDHVFVEALVRARDLLRGQRGIAREQDRLDHLRRVHAASPPAFSDSTAEAARR